MNELLAQMYQLVMEHQLTMDNVYLPRAVWLKAIAHAKKSIPAGEDVHYNPKTGDLDMYGFRFFQHTGPFIMVLSNKNTRIFLFEVNKVNMEVVSYRMFIGTYARKVVTDADVPGAPSSQPV